MATRILGGLAILVAASASSASITVTSETNAMTLASTIFAGAGSAFVISSASLSYHDYGLGPSSGKYTATAPNNYGLLGNGAVLSSGRADMYSTGTNFNAGTTTAYGVGATLGQSTLLTPITGGGSHLDVTELDITVTCAFPGQITFFYAFGSEEYPEYVGSPYVDGFGLYVGGTNYAMPNGQPVSINHPGMTAVAETELDGMLVPTGASVPLTGTVVNFNPGTFKITFIICDTNDAQLDSTVYIGRSKVKLVDTGTGPVPTPGAAGLVSLAMLRAARRRR
jgi:hypothetical protein